ncbi:hypothetical protein SAMN02799631_03251 [Methylobacterium sp. 174MFSha1.1]|nr:hypothetical protein [Methylobacterium sp. 174MFSha1.1]SFU93542.1 hypothetical protein SAMN02799631_03251 [Methylobacterium sp. 174MFSha1.1]
MGELTLWVCCGATVVLSAAVLITGVLSTMERTDRKLARLRDATTPARKG